MKKLRILLLTLVVSASLFACQSVSAIETTTTVGPITTIPETTLYTGQADGNTYYYDSYQDLVDQIYNDLYDDIYQEVYDDVSAMVTQDLYDEIYATVEANVTDAFTVSELSVYVAALQNKIYNITDIVDASVVGVSTYLGTTGKSVGTGVIYNYDSVNDIYYLITNEHVVSEGDNYRIVFEDDSYVIGTLLGVDADIDIAILSFNGADTERTIGVAALGDSDILSPGTLVIAAGNPQGYSFFGSVTLGIVAGVNRDVDGETSFGYIQHDAPINAGNSGGPLFNLNGEVVGINVSKLASTDIEGMGFSIPINTVIEVITTIAPNSLP